MSPSIVAAVPAHMNELKANLRARDAQEIIDFGSSIEESFRLTWRRSLLTKTVLAGGRVVAVFGVGGAATGGTGQPWLLTTGLFERFPVFVLREARRETLEWLRIFERLESLVDAGYSQACGFLEHIGYTLDPPRPIATGINVRRFWMER